MPRHLKAVGEMDMFSKTMVGRESNKAPELFLCFKYLEIHQNTSDTERTTQRANGAKELCVCVRERVVSCVHLWTLLLNI